jgi:hypothetical protein
MKDTDRFRVRSRRGTLAVALAAATFAAGCTNAETPAPVASADRQAQVAERGQSVMPFDLDRTTHHFTKTGSDATRTKETHAARRATRSPRNSAPLRAQATPDIMIAHRPRPRATSRKSAVHLRRFGAHRYVRDQAGPLVDTERDGEPLAEVPHRGQKYPGARELGT